MLINRALYHGTTRPLLQPFSPKLIFSEKLIFFLLNTRHLFRSLHTSALQTDNKIAEEAS